MKKKAMNNRYWLEWKDSREEFECDESTLMINPEVHARTVR
jgi:hypothetical protein